MLIAGAQEVHQNMSVNGGVQNGNLENTVGHGENPLVVAERQEEEQTVVEQDDQFDDQVSK